MLLSLFIALVLVVGGGRLWLVVVGEQPCLKVEEVGEAPLLNIYAFWMTARWM